MAVESSCNNMPNPTVTPALFSVLVCFQVSEIWNPCKLPNSLDFLLTSAAACLWFFLLFWLQFKKERNIWIIPFIYLEMCLSCFHCVHHSWCGVWWSVIGFPSLMCLLVHFSFIYKFVVYKCKQRFSYWGKLFEYCWRSLLLLTLTVKLVFWTWSHPIFQVFWWCETLPLRIYWFLCHTLCLSPTLLLLCCSLCKKCLPPFWFHFVFAYLSHLHVSEWVQR